VRRFEGSGVAQASLPHSKETIATGKADAGDSVTVVVDVDHLRKIARRQQHIGPRLRRKPAARHAAGGERGGNGSEQVAAVEGGAQGPRPPGDAPASAAAGTLPEDGEKAVVRADEAAAPNLGNDGVAPAADTGIDHREEDRLSRIFGSERGEQVCGRRDAEGGRLVQRVDDARAWRPCGEDCLYLADVEVGRAEIAEEDEGPGAGQAAAFFSLFFSDFFSATFFSAFCSSPAAAAASSARSVSITRASGALSPLRKPIFRMRV
jgi:hypothetical protein